MTDINDKRLILDQAAYQVFSELGFKAANISKITQKANISTGSFYNYYHSKEDIFAKIFIAENRRMHELMMSELDFNQDVLDIFDHAIELMYKVFSDNKILAEYFNPEVNLFLKPAMDECGHEKIFHNFIRDFTEKKLIESGYSDEEMNNLFKVADLLSFFEGQIIQAGNEEYLHSYRTLMHYYVKGIFNS